MKAKECPSCAMLIDERSRVCPICNYEFPVRQPLLKWIAIILLILIILGIVWI